MTEKAFRQLNIDPEFKNLIRPLRREEYRQLELNLVMEGCREDIIAWNDTIVDGHNRYEICNKMRIPYVFNGQHTVEIVALASSSRETPVWCMIYDDLNYEHEADIFANQMKFVKPLRP